MWSENVKFFKLSKISYRSTCYILISNLMFILSKFLSFIFFWANLVPNLKFFTRTEISYRGTLLYAYCDFNVYFFKIFVAHIFLGRFGPVIWISSNWPRGTLLYAYYGFNVSFFKILFIHIFWANLVPKSEVLQINWNLVQAYIAICCLLQL